jgi:NAD(P)-dependent dehydrogenase (short-subunit alcohol dehydrogenase family)
MRFQEKVAIVTGGNSGIGKEVARRFVAEGGLVVVNGRNAAKTEAAVKDIDASGKRGRGSYWRYRANRDRPSGREDGA